MSLTDNRNPHYMQDTNIRIHHKYVPCERLFPSIPLTLEFVGAILHHLKNENEKHLVYKKTIYLLISLNQLSL